ncbi:hypothetical protein NKF26_12140 [Haladaptatus sp. AB618]|nr:hypothetical protein [Haladaptatus sp. AB618]
MILREYGRIPERVYGRDSGERWSAKVRRAGSLLVFHVPHFSTNTITFSGKVTIAGNPASNGSSYSYDIANNNSVDNFTVQVTGHTHDEWDNESGTAIPGSSKAISVGGTQSPTQTTLSVTGQTNSTSSFGGGSGSSPLVSSSVSGSEWLVKNPPESIDSATVQIASGSNRTMNVYVDVGVNPDANEHSGVLVAQDWSAPTAGTYTIGFGQSFDTSGVSSVSIGFKRTGGSGTTAIDSEYKNSTPPWSNDGSGSDYRGNISLNDQVRNLSVTSDTGTMVSFGNLSEGKTVTKDFSVSRSTLSLSFDSLGGSMDWTFHKKEHTETQDPAVEVNGHTSSYPGVLADGETATLSADPSWLINGTNRVNVSVASPAAGPTGQVVLDYHHRATDQQTTEYASEKWTERYNISHTYVSARSDLDIEIPFQSNVVRIRDVEVRRNGSTWSQPEWHFHDGSLHVNPDDVAAQTTIDLRVNGSKVAVENGAIEVLKPTAPGDALDSKIKITEHDSGFAINVGGTADGKRLHYLTNESWQGAAPYTEHLASGEQWIYTPNAGDGSTARVKTLPLRVEPTGDVQIEVADPETPAFHVRSGDTPNEDVTFRWLDATTGEDYVLYSTSDDVVRDDQIASDGPVALIDDDGEETLKIMQDTSGGSGSVSGGSTGAGGGGVIASSSSSLLNSVPVIMGAGALLIGGAALLLARRFKKQIYVLGGTAAIALVVIVLAGESFSPGVILEPIATNVGKVMPVVLLIVTGTGAYWFYTKYIRGYTTIVQLPGGKQLK